MRIKVVVMCHNKPDTTRELYEKLSGCFDVTVFDSGSDEGKRPICPCETFPNLYWTGCWAEAMKRYGDYDFLWVVGGDVTLRSTAGEYLKSLTLAATVDTACWSPAIEGRCREIMRADKAGYRTLCVCLLEGQAMALSGRVMAAMGRSIPPGSRLGWGVDFWMCWMGWKHGMRNILDGSVRLYHPEETGYDWREAQAEQIRFMASVGGPRWEVEMRAHPLCEVFENNVVGEWRR